MPNQVSQSVRIFCQRESEQNVSFAFDQVRVGASEYEIRLKASFSACGNRKSPHDLGHHDSTDTGLIVHV